MEKTARRQHIIKWQLILCAVACAFIAFCALPGGVIAASAAEPVTYIDRIWDEKTKTVKEEIKVHCKMKLDKKEVKNRKSHNESDIIKVQKNISKEIRYDPNKL